MGTTQHKGILSVVIGRGTISRYELAQLKEGTVLRMANMAGRPFAVEYNGRHAACAEVVVLGHRKDAAEAVFGVRIMQVPGEALKADPLPPHNDLVELLPMEIVLDRVPFSLSELADAGVGTIIALERMYTEDLDLMVAGTAVARGTLMVHEENFALRVTSRTAPVEPCSIPRISGAVLDPSREPKLKNYDFKRPDKFSRTAVTRFTQVHTLFVDHLKAMFPEAQRYQVVSTDQAAFYEVQGALASGDYRFLIVSTEQRPGGINIIPSVYGDGRREQKIFLQSSETRHTQFNDKEYQDMLVWWNEELKKWYGFRSFLVAYHKNSPIAKLSTKSSMTELFLSPLENGWRALVHTSLRIQTMTDVTADADIVPKNDMILYTTIADPDDPSSSCMLIYPYITLEPVIPLLD